MNGLSCTKAQLQTALKGKETTKTYKLVEDLPNNFRGTIPENIAKGMCRMKGLPYEAERAVAQAKGEYH